MVDITAVELVSRVLGLGKEQLTVSPELNINKSGLKQALLELLEYEYLLDIKIKRIPMCFIENAFDHLDNDKSDKKIKSHECFSCKFNNFCNGFLPEAEGFVKCIRDLPNEVIIELTGQCNLKCEFCFNQYEYCLGKRDEVAGVPTRVAKTLIKQTKQMGVDYVRFTGGEPLLRKDLFQLMGYTKNLGLHVWLNTNATLINESNIAPIERYVENVLVSLNGFDNDSEFRVTRVRGSFAQKLRGIRLLHKVGLVRGGIVLTPTNARNLEQFYKLAQRVGFDSIEFYRPMGKHTKQLRQAIEAIISLNKKYGQNFKIANAIPFCFHKLLHRIALGGLFDDGTNRMVIDTRGNIKPNYYSPQVMGNLKTTRLWNAWNSQEWRDLRFLKLVPKECKNCIYLQTCRGGSRAMAMRYGDGKRDPMMASPVTQFLESIQD